MAPKKHPATAGPGTETKTFDFGSAIAIGVSLGMIFGLLMDNIGMGMAGGLMLATLTNAYNEKKRNVRHGNTAFAISLLGVLFYFLLLALMTIGWL